MKTANGAGRRRKNGAASGAECEGAPQPLAGFHTVEIRAAEAPMWPVHPLAWLEPAVAPRLPDSSGLPVERRHRVPIPGFIAVAIDPFPRRNSPERATGVMKPRLTCIVPQSDLALVGWDARAYAGGAR